MIVCFYLCCGNFNTIFIYDWFNCSIGKQDTLNETLSRGVLTIEEHQEKTQYPKQYQNATGKRLWSGKDNEI